jgi:DNA repair protein RadC
MIFNADQNAIINQALSIIANAFHRENLHATSPHSVKKFCQLQLAHLEHEVFGVLFLDNQHRLIEFRKMFRGGISSSSVHPREVAKEALLTNSSAVIFTHNHPIGAVSPSDADKAITKRLVDALEILEIRVLDHLVVGHDDVVSFAEIGLL